MRSGRESVIIEILKSSSLGKIEKKKGAGNGRYGQKRRKTDDEMWS